MQLITVGLATLNLSLLRLDLIRDSQHSSGFTGSTCQKEL